MTKRIAILGSTGSIGKNALRVIEALGPEYKVVALTAHSRTALLAEQAERFAPDFLAVTNPQNQAQLHADLKDYSGKVLVGPEALSQIAALPQVDVVLAAIVGAAGLNAVLTAAEHGKTLAIANKEPLVIAGQLLTETAEKNNAVIIPVDSEHSAVFQAMQSGRTDEVKRIILTASGGPFRNATSEQIGKATLEDALVHPTWDMGPKITIDSATMMNKALEVIEAVRLFKMPPEKIDVLVHPESVVHSLVEFIDGAVIAQLSPPDMCLPIQYALTYPQRTKGIAQTLKLDQLGKLTFEKPDLEVFRALSLGYEVARKAGTAPAVFNAANEAAVKEFLAGKIKFAMIVELIEHCVNKHDFKAAASLDDLLQADAWARKEVERKLKKTVKTV